MRKVFRFNGAVYSDLQTAKNNANATLARMLSNINIEFTWPTNPAIVIGEPGLCWMGYHHTNSVKFRDHIYEESVL